MHKMRAGRDAASGVMGRCRCPGMIQRLHARRRSVLGAGGAGFVVHAGLQGGAPREAGREMGQELETQASTICQTQIPASREGSC